MSKNSTERANVIGWLVLAALFAVLTIAYFTAPDPPQPQEAYMFHDPAMTAELQPLAYLYVKVYEYERREGGFEPTDAHEMAEQAMDAVVRAAFTTTEVVDDAERRSEALRKAME